VTNVKMSSLHEMVAQGMYQTVWSCSTMRAVATQRAEHNEDKPNFELVATITAAHGTKASHTTMQYNSLAPAAGITCHPSQGAIGELA